MGENRNRNQLWDRAKDVADSMSRTHTTIEQVTQAAQVEVGIRLELQLERIADALEALNADGWERVK